MRALRRTRTFGLILAVTLVAANSAGAAEGQSFGDSMKKGMSKLTEPFSPKPPKATDDQDNLNLGTPGKPPVRVYVATARLLEEGNKYGEAEEYYKKALKAKEDDVGAILGYAGLKERIKKYDEALKLYDQALKEHPEEASVYNNVGLFYARQKRLDDAAKALARAAELQPTNALYRNNLATVLVDQGRLQEAFTHMQYVHGEAGAYYNLGYLLMKRGQREAAERHFRLALQSDPTMQPARVWLARLQSTPPPMPSVAQAPVAQGSTVRGPASQRVPAQPVVVMPPALPQPSSRSALAAAPALPTNAAPAPINAPSLAMNSRPDAAHSPSGTRFAPAAPTAAPATGLPPGTAPTIPAARAGSTTINDLYAPNLQPALNAPATGASRQPAAAPPLPVLGPPTGPASGVSALRPPYAPPVVTQNDAVPARGTTETAPLPPVSGYSGSPSPTRLPPTAAPAEIGLAPMPPTVLY